MIVNKGYPKRCDYLAHVNDTFKVYLKLQNLDESGSKFDVTGSTFDFVNKSGAQQPYRQSIYNISPVETEDVVYIPIEYEKNRLKNEVTLKNSLLRHIGSETQTWTTGNFKISKDADNDPLETDVIIIDTPTLKVMITVLLEAPEGEIPEPGIGVGSFVLGSTFIIA